MQVREELRIDRPADEVREAFSDPALIFGCIPGVSYDGPDRDGAHLARVTIDTGRGRLVLRGSAAVASDDAAGAEIDIRAVDEAAQGRVRGSVSVAIEDGGLFSMVRVHADLTTSGSVAEAARSGYLGEAIQRSASAFAECLERRLDSRRATLQEGGAVPTSHEPPSSEEERPGWWFRLRGRLRRR